MGNQIIRRVFSNPYKILGGALTAYPEMGKILKDEFFLKLKFRSVFGYKLDLQNPITFNEKLQWLKLYDHNPLYSQYVDKFEVKSLIGDLLGKQYVIPCLGLWETVEDIDIVNLPNAFVLKCTHDSGGVVICRDKKLFDFDIAKKKLSKSMKHNFYYNSREWPYKNIRPRIIAEPYLTNDDSAPIEQQELSDYKFYCFNGYVDCVMICYDRASGDTKFYFFDKDWSLRRINKRGLDAPVDFSLPRPQCLTEMFEIASRLSKGIPFVRVDLYQSNGNVLFGEMTFYPQSGFDPNYLPETDEYFGSLIDLTLVKKN